LRDLKLDGAAIYADICQRLFHAPGGGHLVVERVKGDSGELLLKVGEAEQAFGVINVGCGSAGQARRKSWSTSIRWPRFASEFGEAVLETCTSRIRQFISWWVRRSSLRAGIAGGFPALA
jgi:hypothetical protein